MPADMRPVDVTVDTIERDGAVTRVTHVTAGGAGERAFVLVAGIGVAANYFEFLAPLLAQEADVYALDLPGFAGLPNPRSDPTPAFFAEQVEAVLERHELRDPILIGHSMGTQVVTEVLARRDDLTCAVLVSPVVYEAEATLLKQAVRFAQATVRESLHLAMTAFAAYLLCGMLYFLEVLPHMMRYRISERLPLTDARVLLIRGEFDRPSPRRFHSQLIAVAADASRWEIEGAAHSVINGHAVGVARLTLRHVADDLERRGRMSEAEAAVPPARHADVRMVLSAVGSRFDEWFSALRNDERGVARAKSEHARILWRAYRSRG